MKTARPGPFWLYIAVLAAVLTGALTYWIAQPANHLADNLVSFIVLTVLLAVAESTDLSYYEGEVRWGLSPAEAVLVPMLIMLSPEQVVIGALFAMAVMVKEWRDPSKQIFNVIQFGVAALLATSLFSVVADPASAFSPRDAAGALLGAVTFSLITHVLVGLAVELAQKGRLLDAFGEVRWTIVTNLLGSVTLGLFAASAFVAAPWLLAVFPVAMAALYFGYRAVARQASERQRVERQHEATRLLSTSSELPHELSLFLARVGDVLSTVGARAVIRTRDGLMSTTVYAGETVEWMEPVEGTDLESFLEYVKQTQRPLLFGPDHDPVPSALRKSGGQNVLAVPIIDDGEIDGLLIVGDRVGAGDFADDDIQLLEALATDLALSAKSYRLFEEIVEERERFQLLVESVHDYAIYMLDQHGKVVSWNSGAERIFGYASEEIVDRHHSTFYPPESHGSSHEELNRALMRGHVEAEGHRIRKDGSLFVANEIIAPMRSPNGALNGFAKVTRDITERVRAEAERETLQTQLHQAQRLESVGQLAGGVAHDFNNLLSVITNAASFAMDTVPKGSEAMEDLRDVKNAAKRATELTRQLLIFSRRDLFKPQIVDLNEIIQGALKLLSRALGEQVSVRAELDDSIGTVKADPGQLEQVLMNLAINARDAMPGGGTVTIQTERVMMDDEAASLAVGLKPGPHVKLSVTDTGGGMSPAVLQKAFDPFFTTKPKGSGTGLGLATVYGIVKGADGHVNVKSTEGLGTSFEIFLPVETAPEREAASETLVVPEAVQEQSAPSLGETILLVEDDDAVRSVTHRVLKGAGYTVVDASGPKQALTLLSMIKDSVSLLVTDIVMPDMTGVELGERARAVKPDLKIIYMSGYSRGVFSSGGAELTGELLQKPFEKEQLLAAVRNVLDSSSETVL